MTWVLEAAEFEDEPVKLAVLLEVSAAVSENEAELDVDDVLVVVDSNDSDLVKDTVREPVREFDRSTVED